MSDMTTWFFQDHLFKRFDAQRTDNGVSIKDKTQEC